MPMKQEFHKHGTSISLAWNFSFILMKLYSHASLYFTSLSVFYCSLRHINISLIFNSLISQCNPGVSEYLFNIDLIEFSTLRRRLAPLQYIINNQKLTLLL